MLTGALFESGWNPAAAEPDPTASQPNAESYGAYSMRTSGIPGVVGGVLDSLIAQGYTPQQAVTIAESPTLSTAVMLPYYEQGVKEANWNAGIAQGAAQAAYIAEQPAKPYGTSQGQLLGVPASEIVSEYYTQYVVPAESGRVDYAPPMGQTTVVPPGTPPTSTPPPMTGHATTTKTLPGFGGLLQQLDSILNPAPPKSTLYSSKAPPRGVPKWLWEYGTGGAGGGIASIAQHGVGGTLGSIVQGLLFPVEVFAIRLLVAIPGLIGLLMAAAGGILGALAGDKAAGALALIPGGTALKAAAA